MTPKSAMITGVTGQDGSYLAELLASKGYSVIGITSGRTARTNTRSVEHCIQWITGDIASETFVRNLIDKFRPQEVYNLASVATVAAPWEEVSLVARTVALAPLYFLESIRAVDAHIKFFQASSAEMYGAPQEHPQNENTPLRPRNPYGVAKVFAHSLVDAYRRDHGVFAVSGILFNHESPRRGEDFVTRKITASLAKIKLGLQDTCSLGNLDSKRDWGFAGDYVKAMHLALQQEQPEDYVIATGILHSVRDFVEAACRELDMPIAWRGTGIGETGVTEEGKVIVRVEERFYRSIETYQRCGDSEKARLKLGWRPEVTFEDLVAMMVRSDLERLQ